MKYDEDKPVSSGGRGFYIALAICLVAVCGVAVATFVGKMPTDAPSKGTTGTTVTTAVQQVVIPATNVKDERTTTTAAPTTRTTTIKVTTTTKTADLFVFPVSNRVLQPFSDTPVYSETLGSWSTHNGVDFAAENGQAVKAPADGTVKRIYEDGLWGGVIEIEHGGKVVSRCCGVTAQGIKEGDSVKAGQAIGAVTSIPAEIVGDAHIHVEILANDKYVDPLLLMRGDAVRVTTTTAH